LFKAPFLPASIKSRTKHTFTSSSPLNHRTLQRATCAGQFNHIEFKTSGSAVAEGPREALVSRNPATTKHLT